MLFSSKWIAACPWETQCTNNDCRAAIPQGALCVDHGENYGTHARFGCEACAIKYPGSWAGPRPAIIEGTDANPIEVIRILSFSFKKGKPSIEGPHRVWDIRKTVRNPYNDPTLRKLTGVHKDIQTWILRCPQSKAEITRIISYGMLYPTVAIGCQGGRHRSVAVAELLGQHLVDNGKPFTITHRDLKG